MGFGGAARGDEQVGLSAEERGDLQAIHGVGGLGGLVRLVDVGRHRGLQLTGDRGEVGQSRLEPRSAGAGDARAVGFVERRLEHVAEAELGAQITHVRADREPEFVRFEHTRAGDDGERLARSDLDGADATGSGDGGVGVHGQKIGMLARRGRRRYRRRVLVVDDIRKVYPSAAGERAAVDGLSLRIERGEVYGLLGPNGAGKTTTIAMAVGLIEPDAGSVRYEGLGGVDGSPTDPVVRARLGVCPQRHALYDGLSARENLVFFGRVFGVADVRTRADELLDRVGLLDRARDRVSGFSGGMKRRLNLACALMHDPAVLLLDEPSAGVDPQSRGAIHELIRERRDAGSAVLLTTHAMDEAARLCDRVGVLDHGKLLDEGTVDALITRHGGESVVTVESPAGTSRQETDDPIAVLRSVLTDEASSVRIDRPDLERVFLNLTGRSLRD